MNTLDPLYGIAHGRFQPFHLEHLSYVQSVMARCEVCVIAITNPVPHERVFDRTSSHRHLAESNPYTYFARSEMVRRSLLKLSVDNSRFTIVPFHLNEPTQWEHFLPPRHQSRFFVRVFSDWESKKMEAFAANGYAVEQIDAGRTKSITATEVRDLMKSGGCWEDLVPQGTRETLEALIR